MPGRYHGSGYQPTDQRLIAIATACRDALPKSPVIMIKAAPAAPLARRQRRAQPWGGPPGACRAISRMSRRSIWLTRQRRPVRGAVFLVARSSSSRSPPSRTLPVIASHAIGSADPRSGVHSRGLAPIEDDRGRAGFGGGTGCELQLLLEADHCPASGGSGSVIGSSLRCQPQEVLALGIVTVCRRPQGVG